MQVSSSFLTFSKHEGADLYLLLMIHNYAAWDFPERALIVFFSYKTLVKGNLSFTLQ